jgi:hypothetical protein
MADQTTDTAAAVAKAQADLKAAETAHAAAQKDKPPRDPELVLADILDELAMRFGHNPSFSGLVAEFKATLPKETPAPEDAPLPASAPPSADSPKAA